MERTALILAPDERGLRKIYTVPAVRRLVLMLHRAGISSVHLIGVTSPYKAVLGDILPSSAFHETAGPESLTEIAGGIPLQAGQRVLIMRANLVTDSSLIARMLGHVYEKRQVLFMGGASRSAADGLFLAGGSSVVPILQALWSHGEQNPETWGDLSFVEGAWGLPCALQEGEAQRRGAESRLLQALSAQKNDDGFLARHLDRRVSRFFSRRLARTSVTPNQITLSGVLVGVLGALFISQADYVSHVVGALLFLCCVVVDGMDGEVARLKLQQSEWGHYLDIISDNVVHVILFVCIAIGLFRQTGDTVYVKAFLLMLVGFGLCAVSVYYNILKRDPDDLSRSPAMLRLMALMANRDFAYLVVVFAAADCLGWFLIGASAGTYVFSGALWGVNLFEKLTVRKELAYVEVKSSLDSLYEAGKRDGERRT